MKNKIIRSVGILLAVSSLFSLSSCFGYDAESQTESVHESETESKNNVFESETESETSPQNKNYLYINEVCSKNETGLTDTSSTPNDNHYDWIEIYNGGDEAIELEGWSLSDSSSKLRKFVFPSVEIKAGEYLIVYACGEAPTGSALYAEFKISIGGETIYLANPNREIVDKVDVPELEADITYGRVADGGAELSRMSPTPNATNVGAELIPEPVQAPSFSQKSGFYGDSFNLEINVPEGCKVYYTLDGNTPDSTSTEYTSAIVIDDASSNRNVYSAISGISPYVYVPTYRVDKGTVVRAVAVSDDGRYSKTVTATYFVGFEDKNGYKDIPVISLTTDSDNLFDHEKGIYVQGQVYEEWKSSVGPNGVASIPGWQQPGNYSKRGEEWEREANIEYFDSEQNLVLSSGVGIRIHGAASRSQRQKSFNVYFRDDISGFDKVTLPLFNSVETISSFMLRNGGNDTESTKFRDMIIQSLVSDRDMATQEAYPCILFINGEYWGVYNFQEKYKGDYFEEHYGVDSDDVVMIKNGTVEIGKSRDSTLYSKVLSICRGELNDESYAKVCELIDVDSFIDYIATEVIIANSDWGGNNYALWRTRTVDESNPYADGKWRWVLFDTEFSSGLTSSNSFSVDSFKTAMSGNVIFEFLIKNEDFRARFATVLADLLNENFESNTVRQTVRKLIATYSEAMTENYRRFVTKDPSAKRFEEEWDSFVGFFGRRRNRIMGFFADKYSTEDVVKVTLSLDDISAGYVKLNTIEPEDLKEKGTWKGYYFSEYAITLTAVEKEGHKFERWEIDGAEFVSGSATDKTVSVKCNSDTTVKAVFSKT